MRPVTTFLRLLVKTYRLLFSPLVGHNCRFRPTCSEYALEALDKHGAIKGVFLIIKRLLRCGPWGKAEFDPVPPPKNKQDI